MGAEAFWKIKGNSIYKDPDVPPCFLWLFNTCIEMYGCCGESLTWTEIESYAKIRNVKFTQLEVDYLLLINSTANSQISKMRKEED